MSDEFKTQFQPAMLISGSSKVPHRDGGKHYVACFMQGRRIVHESHVPFKTATLAKAYAKDVQEKYRRMVMYAFSLFLESQDVQPTS